MLRHILLADDSTTIHRIVTDILQRENIQVTCVENGEEALRSVLQSPPDLVLADLTMPRMGGIELCELMKREKEFRDIPVIFLVSPFDDYNEGAAQRAGGSGHLVKPFDSYRLMTLVRKYLPPDPPAVPGLEDHEVTTIEQIDEESDDAVSRALHATATVRDEIDVLADLPEPEGLTVSGIRSPIVDDLTAFSALELSDNDRAIETDTVELDVSALKSFNLVDLTAETPLVTEEQVGDEVADLVRAQLAAMGGMPALEHMVREVIREEVRRILPQIVEGVVRDRVREIELELEQRGRAEG